MRLTRIYLTFSPSIKVMDDGSKIDDMGPVKVVEAGHKVRWLLYRPTRPGAKNLVNSLEGAGYAWAFDDEIGPEVPDPPGTPSMFREAGRTSPTQTVVSRLTNIPVPPRADAPKTKPSRSKPIETGLRMVELEE